MKPLVSILIPAYNAGRWIADTLESARTQTWCRKEIIVVDDGSSDDTLAVARRFASAEIKVVAQPNQGAAAARNHALSLCQGDLIQWLDADDLLSPDKIEKQVGEWEKYRDSKILFSSAWGSFICRTHKTKFRPTSLWCDLSPKEWLLRKLEQNVYMQTAAWLTSRELTDQAGPWDIRMLGDDDGEYFCRILLQSSQIKFIPDARVYYRLSGPASLSYVGRSDRKLEALLLSMQMHIGYLQRLDPGQRARAAAIQYLQTGLPLFFPHRLDLVNKMQEMAGTLGGRLQPVRLSWKYSYIQRALGWNAAKWVELHYNRAKATLQHSWDRTLYGLEATL